MDVCVADILYACFPCIYKNSVDINFKLSEVT